MWNPKCFLFTVSIFILGAASAQAAGEILRNADGSINKYMNQYEAMKACPAGTHLPTARELAKEAQARGAKGILEVNQVRRAGKPNGYYEISAINPDGQDDVFYFNEDGYKRPDDALEGMLFWSSSSVSFSNARAFLFNGDDGGLPYGGRYGEHAVRCATDH